MIETNDIERRFNYHAAATDEKRQAHEAIRAALRTTAHFVNGQVPDGREKALAITHLEEAMFWANAALARTEG